MGALVRETFRSMVDQVELQLQATDLNLSQWLTLKLMGQNVISCIGDVSREVGLESGASTRLVDQLEINGLIDRRRCEADRRVVKITLTQSGRKMLARMHPRIAGFWEERLRIFTADERAALFGLLRRLRDDLKQPPMARRAAGQGQGRA